MCGIAGLIQFKNTNNKLSIKDKKDLLKIMRLRGPNYQDSFNTKIFEKNIYLFSSRLSILDLNKRSNQPYFFKKKVLVYNGEIYNFKEIRNFLKLKGYNFITDSDTEVVIKSYDFWGQKCFKHFEGMWALAIVDSEKKQLVISRDFFGEKPLYFQKTSNYFAFGSEISYIKKILNKHQDFSINPNKIQDYLSIGYKFLYKNNETFVKNIYNFEKGSCFILNLENNHTSIKKFEKNKFLLKNKDNFDDIINKSRNIFLDGLKKRLRSDVPISFCLSGGIDSGTLVSAAVKHFNIKPTCYSIIDNDKRYNESKNIRFIEKDLGINCKKINLRTEKFDTFLDKLNNLIKYKNAPVSTISYYIHSLISEQSSKDGNKVIFSGTGADELFTGYYDHHLFYLSEIKKNKHQFKNEMNYWKNYVQPFIRNPLLSNPKYILNNPKFRDHIMPKNRNIFINYKSQNNFFENKYSSSNLKNRMLNELFHESVPVILHEDDSNSMLYSIENRSPYLNYKLLKYIQSINLKYFIKKGYTKNILREMGSGILTDKVRLSREKKGFNTNLNSIVNLKNSEIIEYIVSQKKMENFINLKNIKKIKLNKLSNTMNKSLFNILNVSLFLEN